MLDAVLSGTSLEKVFSIATRLSSVICPETLLKGEKNAMPVPRETKTAEDSVSRSEFMKEMEDLKALFKEKVPPAATPPKMIGPGYAPRALKFVYRPTAPSASNSLAEIYNRTR